MQAAAFTGEGTAAAAPAAVKVCIRLKPLLPRERGEPPMVHWKEDKQTICQIDGTKSFSFDRVFHAGESTQTVYEEVAHSLVLSTVQGYNGTIFAYGQTSSGKTYTMMGNNISPGIVPLTVHRLFKVIESMPDREFLLRVSYMEIYNENVTDLLVKQKGKPLEIREDIQRTVYVADLNEEVVATFEDAMAWLRKGEKNRHYGETKMNEHSSRSHTIFRMILESREKNDVSTVESIDEAVKVAHLNLVDLAGSERASQTGADGVRLKEGCNINRSLFVLGQVIKKLSDGQTGRFINYRDSKVTRILQNSLGGNAKTVIICTITADALEETVSTLQFASTAKFMKNTPHVNEVLDDQAMLKRYRKEIMDLKVRLEQVTSETLAQAMEKAQLLAEKQGLQQEHELKMKNLTRMLITASPEEKQAEIRARRKRRVTWAPGKQNVILQSDCGPTKISKLDDITQELDETEDNDDFWDSGCTFSTLLDSTTEISDSKRDGSWELPNTSVPEVNYKRRTRSNRHSNDSAVVDNRPSYDELVKMNGELEQCLEDIIKERKEENKNENRANHLEKQLIESIQLCELLYSEKDDVKNLKNEIEKQKQEIHELKKLMNGKKEIEEFEYLEKEIQNVTETEINNETKVLKQDQNILDLQNQVEHLKEVAARNLQLYTCTAQGDGEDLRKKVVQLQQSLDDAEILICDGNKHSAFQRSEIAQMKEEMDEMRMKYQQMKKETQLYRNKLNAERTRYSQMQTDMQKELQHVFIENTKLTTLMDGKVPKDLLDRVHLEKTISELQQQLVKASEEKAFLQQEINVLTECESVPDEVERLTTLMAVPTTELCILTEEKEKLLAEREEYKHKYEELMAAKGQVDEELMAAQSRLQESKHKLNELNNQCKQLQLQLSMVIQKTDQVEHHLTGLSAEKDELRNDVQNSKKQETQHRDGCEDHVLEDERLNPDQSTVTEGRNQIEVKELKEQLYSLQQNINTLRNEKEQLQQHQANLETEREQLKCDLQESIQMCVENQADMRNLQEELKVKLQGEVELKESLSEKDLKINEEKQKTVEYKQKLDQLVSQHDHLLIEVELRRELIPNVSKVQILDQEFNHQIQQIQSDAMEKILCEKHEMETQHRDGCEDHVLEDERLNPDQSTVTEGRNQIEVKELKAQLYSLQQNINTLRNEKEQLQQHQASLETESEQLKCDLQESIEMSVENQADVRNLQEELKVKLQSEVELKQSLSERDLKINEEKQKTLEYKNELDQLISQYEHLMIEVEQHRLELKTHVSKALGLESNHQVQQLESDAMEMILCDMPVENQADMRNLQEELKVKLESEIKLKQSLLGKDLKIHEEKQQTLEYKNELQQVVSQRDHLLIEVEQLKHELVTNISKAQILDQEFNHQVQQLESEKLSLVLEKDELQHKLESVHSQRDAMEKSRCEMAEMSVENQAGVRNLAESLAEKHLKINEEKQKTLEYKNELQQVVSQRDHLLIEVEQLKHELVTNVSKTQILDQEFNHQVQQLESEKMSLGQEKDELQHKLESVQSQRDAMEKTLFEMETQHRDGCGDHVLEDERLNPDLITVTEGRNQIEVKELKEQLYSLQQNINTLRNAKEQLQQHQANLETGCEQLKCDLQESIEMSVENQADMRNLQEELKVKLQNEMELKQSLSEKDLKINEEKQQTLEYKNELQQIVSQRDHLLIEVEQLKRELILNVSKAQTLDQEFNHQVQQLESEKLSLVLEKDELQHKLESIQSQRDVMEKSLCERAEMRLENQTDVRNLQELKVKLQSEVELKQSLSEKDLEINEAKQMTLEYKNELQQVVSQRDHLLIEVGQLKRELVTNVSKTQILDQEFNHQVQQLESEKLSLVLEKDELQHKLESVQSQIDAMEKSLCEKAEMVVTIERRNQEQTELVSVLEKQIATLEQKLVNTESSQPENNGIEMEINKLSCHLQEKALLLQSTTKDFAQVESKYTIRLSNIVQEFSQETGEWRDLLTGLLSETAENVTLSKTIEELQRENLEQHEQYEAWKWKFTVCLSTVPYYQKKFEKSIARIDTNLVEERSKQNELLVQLQALDSDSANLHLPGTEERNSEIKRLSILIEDKNQQLQETKKNLSELDSKYQNYLTIMETELQSEIKARKELHNHRSNHPRGNISSTIERIQHENERLQQEGNLLKQTVLSTAKLFSPISVCPNKFTMNSELQLANQKTKNKELLLQIQALRERESTENGCDPLQTVEDQKLCSKPKRPEQDVQNIEMKIGKHEKAEEMSQERCKLQENKALPLQTEFSSKTLDNKNEALQAELAGVDKCSEPLKQEIADLQMKYFKLKMEKAKESKHLEQQISSLKASSNHKDELLNEMKLEFRRSQTQQDISYMKQSEEETCPSNSSTASGSGIVQNALVLVLKSDNAKLKREVTYLVRKNQSLSSVAAKQENEIRKWKEKLARLEEAGGLDDLKSEDMNLPSTSQENLVQLPPKQQTSFPQKVPPSVDVSTHHQGQSQSLDSSETKFFNLESQSRHLHPSKFFDNSGLGSFAGDSPQQNPEKDYRRDWWKKSSSGDTVDNQCKTQ